MDMLPQSMTIALKLWPKALGSQQPSRGPATADRLQQLVMCVRNSQHDSARMGVRPDVGAFSGCRRRAHQVDFTVTPSTDHQCWPTSASHWLPGPLDAAALVPSTRSQTAATKASLLRAATNKRPQPNSLPATVSRPVRIAKLSHCTRATLSKHRARTRPQPAL